MLKIFVVLIFLPTLFLFSVSEKSESVLNTSPTPNPTKTPVNEKQGVENLTFDKETVYLWCPSSSDSEVCSKSELNIKVKTFSKDAEKKGLNYYYTVSGGQIIGQGADVVWNFSDVKPGNYTITASVGSDYVIYGKTVSKNVELKECPDCDYWAFCECPTFEIAGPTKPIRAGDSFIISANVSGGSQESVTYNWKITGGTIISKKNAPQIIVKADSTKNDTFVKATLEISGLCATCPNEESGTFQIK